MDNRAPRLADDSVSYDGIQALDVLANDLDLDGQLLAVTATTDPAHGSVSCSRTGACLYRPAAGFDGDDSFSYTAEDSGGATSQASVALRFTGRPSDPVVARDDKVSTTEDVVVQVEVLGNDHPATDVTVSGWTQPGHGTVSCDTTGQCTYDPAPASPVSTVT